MYNNITVIKIVVGLKIVYYGFASPLLLSTPADGPTLPLNKPGTHFLNSKFIVEVIPNQTLSWPF